MRYQLKESFFSVSPQFTIYDEAGLAVYFCEGKLFSVGDKLSFRDAEGRECGAIEQKVMSLKKKYFLYREDQLFAEIVKDLTLFRANYTVTIPGPCGYTVRGNFLGHEYEFFRGDRTVAKVSKKFFALSDTYGVDIVAGEDDLLILAVAIVIDLVNSPQ